MSENHIVSTTNHDYFNSLYNTFIDIINNLRIPDKEKEQLVGMISGIDKGDYEKLKKRLVGLCHNKKLPITIEQIDKIFEDKLKEKDIEDIKEKIEDDQPTVKQEITVLGTKYKLEPVGPKGGMQPVSYTVEKKLLIEICGYEVKFYYKEKQINQFNYRGKVENKHITQLTTVLKDIGAFDKPADARRWITNEGLFNKLLLMREALDIKKKERIKRDFSHLSNAAAIITRYTDYLDLANKFYDYQPFFFDKSNMWWLWDFDNTSWKMIDHIDLMNEIDDALKQPFTVKASEKSEIIESLKRVGRKRGPEDMPKTWIQFKDKMFDIKTGSVINATPDYFCCNPIQWSIGDTDKTPTMDKLFEEWVGKKYVPTLYEIIAYCCLVDYPIHLIFCFIGGGRNGKSKFQELLRNFIGIENTCSSELDTLLESKFESAKLYKKLVCSLGETNFGVMNKTSLLKKLAGQDLIGYEFKNKKPFDDFNYAKILINSNSLPSTEDTSEGFWRRWMIIEFPNQFEEGTDILSTIPEIEYNNLAKKITNMIKRLLNNGKFTNQGTIEDRKQKYIMASNPLPLFLEHACYRDEKGWVMHSKLYSAYNSFLNKSKRRVVNRKEFNQVLIQEGLEQRRTSHSIDGTIESGYFIEGLCLKSNWENEIMQIMQIMHGFTVSSPRKETNSEVEHNLHNLHNSKPQDVVVKEEKLESYTTSCDVYTTEQYKIHLPCSKCGLKSSDGWDTRDQQNKLVCDACADKL